MNEIQEFLRQKLNSPLPISRPQLAKLPMGTMEFVTYGNGKPVLIIHGGGGGYDQAVLLFKRYIPDGYQMICPSRPGYLGTPIDTGQTAEEQADALAGLLDYLNITSAIIVAISAGGLSLYPFAIRHPKKTKAIIAIDAIAGEYLMPEQSNKLAQALFMTDFGLWVAKKSMIYFPKSFIKNLIKLEGYLDPVRVDDRVKEILNCRERLEIIAELMNSMADYKARKTGTVNDMAEGAKTSWYDFSKINCPALIIHGTHDADVKFYNGVFAYERLASKEKERFWIEYGTHFGFFFAHQARKAQQKFREFVIKHG
ncbi:TPA: alpha/beta hydrolase [Legionella pneumophila]|nr:alpha/beta hydrolase [Legionella pneumophila]HAU2266078.1 alpha/beta hydrolase [Legionella pneumophila]